MLASLLRQSIEVVQPRERVALTAENRMLQIIEFMCCNVNKEGLRPKNAAREIYLLYAHDP